MNINIRRITVSIKHYGDDDIILWTDLPNTYSGAEGAVLKLIAPNGAGLNYVRSTFPNIDIEVLFEKPVEVGGPAGVGHSY